MVVGGTTGVGGTELKREWGTTSFITQENRDETVSGEDGCIHHRLTPPSAEDEPLDQTGGLSPRL